ncbi:TetR/AcrR family transcriptional regulator [Streptomyces sp. NPDC005931]|uniref:TetR/AcrR family transcriptional regulator n=1 Tax=Streptomyces sp. NPDC005931 TaxID=3364737 RepID=UPI0036B705E4
MTSGTSSTSSTGGGDITRTLELLWNTGPRPSRGPRPGLTLDRIVDAAVRVADTEGIEAVSMRRMAAELGTGAMSLYRYVPGKAELLDLMLDRVQAETPDLARAERGGEGWRAAVEALARGYLAHFRRHPWLLRVNQARTVLGPSSLRSLEAALVPLRRMGLSDPELISVILAVQSFTGGIARMELDADEAAKETGLSNEEFWGTQQPYLERAMTSGEYPTLATLSEDTFAENFDHFDFGLQRLLDGLEVLVARRGGTG